MVHDDGLYYKPKGMHCSTFHATIDELEGLQSAAMGAGFLRLLAQCNDLKRGALLATCRAEGYRL